jgi:uncharacterized phiE125 gp8 family phage protein
MDDVVLITPPAMEPVTLTQVKSHAKIFTTADDTYISTIIIPASRQAIEDELKQVLVTQTWLLKRDGFPGFDPRYESFGYPTILVPKPPFQAIGSFTYVDVAGITQTLYQCNPDGTTPTINGVQQYYGYQLDPGSETQPARLLPPWARPWPPSRRIPMSVQVQFVAGYGPSLGAITAARVALLGSPAVAAGGSGYQPGDTGFIDGSGTTAAYTVLTVGEGGAVATFSFTPGRGNTVANDVATFVGTGDGDGNFAVDITAIDTPPVFVSGAIPMPIISAILLEASHLYYNRDAIVATEGKELARGVSALLSPYVNRIA